MKLLVQPEAGLTPVVRAISRARTRIDIAIFRLDRREIEASLAAAVQRGVKVRALVAHTNSGGEARLRKLEQRLLQSGVSVSRTSGSLTKYHGKYLLADDTLHLMAFNYTKIDLAKSRSFGIQTRHRRAVADAAHLFECDLTRQVYGGSARSPLIVSPETSREALSTFIAGARRRLAIYDNRLDDRAFVKLLRGRAEAGVRIQVLGKAPSLKDDFPVLPLKDLRLHARAIIRDGTHVFVGSQSLRRAELEDRREVGLIIRNPAVARHMLQVFDTDWSDAGGDDDAGTPAHDAGRHEVRV
jgi:phosphatidylserine/phosphatidylglycerophosphate/cardiolipin synthase-like enzyme